MQMMARRWLQYFIALLICAACATHAAAADSSKAEALRAKYAALADQLQHNQFQAPLYLDSSEGDGHVAGDIYARLDYPFATVRAALNDSAHGPQNWCDVLILHINTKGCRAGSNDAGTVLMVHIGSKEEQALDDAYPVKFNYQVVASNENYFRIVLSAADGPLGTSDYRIMLEAVDIGQQHTFLHLTYAYSFGLAGSIAMKTYLATAGRDKVGFTITGKNDNGEPQYIGGLRGVIERNTMRYYLAIDAYLSALGAPPAQQIEQCLQNWYAATEKYPRQLHEVEREDYLSMKRKEYRRQHSAP